jgi:hypothetical protein
MLSFSAVIRLLKHFQNNNIKMITERNLITRYATFYLGKPSWGRKRSKNSPIIDFQYNANTKAKTTRIN